MSKHFVSVSQLVSNSYKPNAPDAYLNVIENIYEAIGVWTIGTNLTVLLSSLTDNYVTFLQFANRDAFDEWYKSESDKVKILWQGEVNLS